MNWTETMMQNAAAVRNDTSISDTAAARGMPSMSWDPYDVWLTRIQQPRENARRAGPVDLSVDGSGDSGPQTVR